MPKWMKYSKELLSYVERCAWWKVVELHAPGNVRADEGRGQRVTTWTQPVAVGYVRQKTLYTSHSAVYTYVAGTRLYT